MKVLLLAEELPGRSEAFVVDHALALRHLGHQVEIVATRQGSPSLYDAAMGASVAASVRHLASDEATGLRPLAQRLTNAAGAMMRSGVASPRVAGRFGQRCLATSDRAAGAARLARYAPFASAAPDVVHVESPGLARRFPLLGDLLAVPVVVGCRVDDVERVEIGRLAEPELVGPLRAADAVVCSSHVLAARLSAALPAARSLEVHVVPVATAATPAATSTPSPPLIGLVGPLDRHAGAEHVVIALARLRDEGVDLRVRVVGGGPLASYARFSADALGLGDAIDWIGPLALDAVDAAVADIDVLVTSGVDEVPSRAAVTAMAAGAAVVTSATGGRTHTELVVDGANGYVVPGRDTAALADRLRRLLADPGLRSTMGSAARRWVDDRHRLEQQATALDQVHRRVGRT